MALLAFAVLGGCATGIPKDALVLTPDTLERRQLESRRYDGTNEKDLLNASAGVLQDLGFNIDESETKLGLIVASKNRSAFNVGQMAAAVVAALFGVYQAMDSSQKIRVSLVTRPALASDGKPIANSEIIRITLQRIIWNTSNQITRVEFIDDPKIYQAFFDKLSKSLFLEAQQV